MLVITNRVIEELCDLCEDEDLKVTITEASKGFVLAGGAAFVGALLGGPVGFAIGATVGGITGGIIGRRKYKSVVNILRDMSPKQREKLANSLIKRFQRIGVKDAVAVLSVMVTDEPLRTAALDVLRVFLHSEGYDSKRKENIVKFSDRKIRKTGHQRSTGQERSIRQETSTGPERSTGHRGSDISDYDDRTFINSNSEIFVHDEGYALEKQRSLYYT